MQFDSVRAIANAVLYEGSMLYPYRPSALKNQRPGWSLFALMPPAYVALNPGESDHLEAQILATADGNTEILAEIRFLHLGCGGDDSGKSEMLERVIPIQVGVASLLKGHFEQRFTFPVPGAADGFIIESTVRMAGRLVDGELLKIELRVSNTSAAAEPTISSRDAALRWSMLNTNAALQITGGEFVSLLDTPEPLREAAKDCRQTGVFPVLAGTPGERTAMLASPIILYDYPGIAPESRGDFFDSSEIDELLALRVLTLAEGEKDQIKLAGQAARQLLERTEAFSARDFHDLHGAFRDTGWPGAEPGLGEEPEKDVDCSVRVFGKDLKKGDRVRLWPQGRADILDIALKGKLATIERIEHTLEGEPSIAVTLDDDPGRHLGEECQVGHRFFFRADELEPISATETTIE